MFLIADSGSTKTDWALVGVGGKVLRSVKTQGINPFHQTESDIRMILHNELAAALPEDDVERVYFYGSGCRLELEPMMVRLLGEHFSHARQIEAHGDLLGAARALCGRGEGIACILGTGANSCYYDGERIVENTPPLGYILGDEGSGAVLGRLFINALFKGGLPHELRDDFLNESGMTMADIIARVYREPMANRWLASTSLYIYKHMACPELEQLVIDNFREFFRRNIRPYGRQTLKVGAVGSIAYFFEKQLSAAARMEGYEMGKVMRTPIDGLLLFHNSSTFC